MSIHTNAPTLARVLEIAIAIVQVFDIVIHAATNQLEPLRVTSNIIIFLWLAVVVSGRISPKFLQAASVSSISAYLGLNLIFLALEGMTNVEQGGELRTMLFVLMFLTIALSILLAYTLDKQKEK
jgi:hypothetical protein